MSTTTIIKTPIVIPSSFGSGGSKLVPKNGEPSLVNILLSLQAATIALDAAVGASDSSNLASTSAGEGASLIGIQDAGALYTATTVEAALAEVRTLANATQTTANATQTTANAAVPLASVQYVTGKTLVAGDVAVSTGVTITAGSQIIPIREQADATHVGALSITNKTVGGPGVGSFHIHNANNSATDVVGAIIIG